MLGHFKHEYKYEVVIDIIECDDVQVFLIGGVCALKDAETITLTIFSFEF